MDDLQIISQALEFAAKKHRDQRRKDLASSPYINHPISLMNILINEGLIFDPLLIAAAILHDTIEDTNTTKEELLSLFGEKITNLVLEVTDDKSLKRSERKDLQIKHAAFLSPSAAKIKLADKISNLRDLKFADPQKWSSERQSEYREWAKQVVDNIQNPDQRLLEIFKLCLLEKK